MNTQQLLKELKFKAIRSSGAGGQHVNKVSSKIELAFNIETSIGLTDEEKELLYKNISNQLSKEKILLLTCQETRSQHQNKELVIERFLALIKKGLHKPKPRKTTKPSKSSVLKRLDSKKKQSEKKQNRKRFDF